MRFQIESVWADGKRVPLSDSQASKWTDNTFTMVVGQNAAGKSRLLRKIVSTYVFATQDRPYSEALTSHFLSAPEDPTRYTGTFAEHLNPSYPVRGYPESIPASSEHHSWPRQLPLRDVTEVPSLYFVPQRFGRSINSYNDEDVQLSVGSAVCPTHVIAVSTGRHDRFPSLSQSKKKPSGIKYSYIGSERPNGSGVPSSLSSLIDGVMRGQQNAYRLSNIFEYLGFAPYLDIKLSLDIKQFSRLQDAEKSEIHFSCTPEIIDFLSGESSYLPYGDDQQYKFYDTLKRQKKSHLEIYLWDLDARAGRSSLSDLSILLRFGIIKIYDITLIKSSNKSRLRLSQASSGQQCMLTMMLGIAGSIKNGSLVCIDEPEISLHPQWQSSLVKQLQEVFADYHGCHFIIATHSPQLVSGLVTDNGYVLSLEETRLYKSYEYAKRSADFQLAEIFQSPGQNNEYLLRTTLILLTKIAKREDFNQDDREAASKLFQIQSKMSNTDPVYHLISQLGALY
ncbi:AAA family ATPase [Pseudomonas viridiflava]|uniref:AAA family ATPase n=1 Tax=Pseudomonas viridiflava TaxID=33069 RepID=UPI002EB6AC38|nr:AAA family ATPase [Pseudomonas viridiflava]